MNNDENSSVNSCSDRSDRRDEGNDSQKSEKSHKKARRTLSNQARDARYQMRLADEYGQSRIARGEPSLTGLTCGTVHCALRLLRRTLRAGRRPSPEKIARQTASILRLASCDEKALTAWLVWLKDRRWVLVESGRSPVIEWAQSGAAMSDIWTEQLADEWRLKLDGQTIPKADPTPSRTNPATVARSVVPEAKAESLPRLNGADMSPKQQSEAPSVVKTPVLAAEPSHGAAPDLLSLAVLSIDRKSIPPLPRQAFKSGHDLANRFAGAVQEFLNGGGSPGNIQSTARSLARDKNACREFVTRSPEHQSFLIAVFRQVGLEVP